MKTFYASCSQESLMGRLAGSQSCSALSTTCLWKGGLWTSGRMSTGSRADEVRGFVPAGLRPRGRGGKKALPSPRVAAFQS